MGYLHAEAETLPRSPGKKREREAGELGSEPPCETPRGNLVGAPERPSRQRNSKKAKSVETRKTPIVRASLSLPDWEDEEDLEEEPPRAPHCAKGGNALAYSHRSSRLSLGADGDEAGADDALLPSGASQTSISPRLHARRHLPGEIRSRATDRENHACRETASDVSVLSGTTREERRHGSTASHARSGETSVKAETPSTRLEVFWKDPANRRILRGLAAVLNVESEKSNKRSEKRPPGAREKKGRAGAFCSVEEERDDQARKLTEWMSRQIDCRRRSRPSLSKERLSRQKQRR
ncbi:hypothetical protein TGVEG_281610 [Toxoplasma gondii VEG]|uniref:Uncharacterized protein n=1 Tax=Toxoplasma gondii (strain ATCC 50861 / VEG) TaxID=432359 RepID=B9QPF8_TOXGV|nr:hypothetical protein TGVEG_281610 [Toxoplasma gondii VEG]CEL74006.1 TPA: hypothetical protein BN1205_088600 [Toxoplasma gondii VEG]